MKTTFFDSKSVPPLFLGLHVSIHVAHARVFWVSPVLWTPEVHAFVCACIFIDVKVCAWPTEPRLACPPCPKVYGRSPFGLIYRVPAAVTCLRVEIKISFVRISGSLIFNCGVNAGSKRNSGQYYIADCLWWCSGFCRRAGLLNATVNSYTVVRTWGSYMRDFFFCCLIDIGGLLLPTEILLRAN
jgi:hypothetical protein